MRITKFLFDNDGVNIDSEDVAMRVMDDWGVALVKRYQPDADLPQDYIYKTYPGTSTDRIVDALIKKFQLSDDLIKQDYNLADDADVPVVIADLITMATNERFQQELKSIPGVTQAHVELRALYGAENIALATTSREDRMDVSLAHAADPVTGANAQLETFFPKGERRRSGYGHANKYDEAFGALGWNPAETVVVEDSLSGVSKAKQGRTDVRVIGTVAAKFYEDKPAQAKALMDAGAALVIADFSDLPKAVKWLDAGMDANKKPVFAGQVFVPAVTVAPPKAGFKPA
jgi:beta-phosphoglucomutase-like phosphatase (HAD superfamily)